MSERTQETPDNETRVRVVAHQVALSLLGGNNQALAEAGLDIARLTAGQDPDEIDTTQPEYIFGASDALSVAISAVGEAIPNQPTVDFLQATDNAKMLAKIASRPDISTGEVIEELSKLEDDMPAEERLVTLKELGLIEPAVPLGGSVDRAWRLSPWGKRTYLKLLPEIAEATGTEPTIHGLRGILDDEA